MDLFGGGRDYRRDVRIDERDGYVRVYVREYERRGPPPRYRYVAPDDDKDWGDDD